MIEVFHFTTSAKTGVIYIAGLSYCDSVFLSDTAELETDGYLELWPLSQRIWTPPKVSCSQYIGRRWFSHERKRNGWTRKEKTSESSDETIKERLEPIDYTN